MGVAMAATAGLFVASKDHMRRQAIEIETTQAARATIDIIVRDLRLGGACLPVTGEYISLEGSDGGEEDEIVTRTGLTRPDLSCIRSATPITVTTPAEGNDVQVQRAEGFLENMRAYITSPQTGTGEYFTITSVDTSTNTLGRDRNFTSDYPPSAGVYAIDERRFYINHFTGPRGELPELMMQVGDDTPQSFAVGIEKLDIQYQLRRNCPPCDVVDLPSLGSEFEDPEWPIVEQIFLTVTARSEVPSSDGDYYRRTMQVGIKPRNLLPR